MRKILFTAALLTSCFCFNSNARSIDEMATEIAANSYDIKLAILSAKAEAMAIKGENRLPDPKVDLEQLWGSKEAGNKLTVGISQEFEFPTVYSNKDKASKLSLESVGELERDILLNKSMEAKQALLEYIYTTKCFSVLQDLNKNLNNISVLIQKAQRIGESTILDYNKLNIEKMDLEQNLVSILTRQSEIIQALKDMGTSDVDSMIAELGDYPADELKSLGYYKDIFNSNDPRKEYNKLKAQSLNSMLKSEKASRLPSFSIGYIFNREAAENFNGVSLGISLPLYSNKAKTEAIRLQRDEIEANSEMINSQNENIVETTYKNASTIKNALSRYQPYVDNNENIELLEKAYRGGELSMIDYLREVNYFTEARLAFLEKEYQYQLLLSQLNKFSLLGIK